MTRTWWVAYEESLSRVVRRRTQGEITPSVNRKQPTVLIDNKCAGDFDKLDHRDSSQTQSLSTAVERPEEDLLDKHRTGSIRSGVLSG
jgi:hypothetical protein